jgi:ATP-dependent Clp protease ATP-binding subunit ClpC
MVRFDMSEFSESTAVSRLIGTPRDPDGELTGKVRLQPFCVLLFDEVEKAHPLVLDLLLQLLGDGRLTDAAGRTVDFRNAIVVMTSNLGARSEDRWLGFSDQTRTDRELHYRRAAEDFFRPELFNRIDHVVPYAPLGAEALRRIARRTLQNLLERRGLRQAQVMVDVDEGLIDYLARRSVDPRYGARTLANRIEQTLVTPLAHELTTWEGGEGLTRVVMTPSDDGVSLSLETIHRAPQQTGVELVTAASEQPEILAELAEVVRRTEQLTDDPRTEEVETGYDEILRQINEVGSTSTDARTLADRLRRREAFLNRLDRLQKRVAGLQDPRGTGEFIFIGPADERERKGHAHRWGKIAAELRTELAWLEFQLRALSRADAGGATAIVSGVSGPYAELLGRWKRWYEALDEAFELEAVWARRARTAGGEAGKPAADDTAFAVSTLAPGARDLFDVLKGYSWSPRPPSHGQHALAECRTLDESHTEPDALAERLGSVLEMESEPYIEFVEADGQLEDVRTGRLLSIPEDRSSNLRDFVTRLVIGKMTAVNG